MDYLFLCKRTEATVKVKSVYDCLRLVECQDSVSSFMKQVKQKLLGVCLKENKTGIVCHFTPVIIVFHIHSS